MADGWEHTRHGHGRDRLVPRRRVLGRSGPARPARTGDGVLDALAAMNLKRERDAQERARAARLRGDG